MWHVRLRRVSTVALTLAGVLALASPALAVILTFSTGGAGTGGTITITGANAVGSNIPLDELEIVGSAADGDYDLSGPVASAKDANGAASLSFDTVAGTVSIFGGVPALLITTNEFLLTGAITTFAVIPNAPFPGFNTVSTSGTDTKSANLLAAIGSSPQAFEFTDFQISFGNPGQAVTTAVLNASVINPLSVAQPFSLLMVGAGLVVLAGMMRMRRRRSS